MGDVVDFMDGDVNLSKLMRALRSGQVMTMRDRLDTADAMEAMIRLVDEYRQMHRVYIEGLDIEQQEALMMMATPRSAWDVVDEWTRKLFVYTCVGGGIALLAVLAVELFL